MQRKIGLIRGVFYGMYFKNAAQYLKICLICVLMCILLLPSTYAQNTQPENIPETESPEKEAEPNNTPLQTEEALPPSEQLIKKTIYLDITTASYYELQDWLRNLELDQDGSRQELENRLLEYYRSLFTEVPRTKLSTDSGEMEKSETTEKKGKNLIQIESAQALDYEKIDDEDALIRLSGGVALYMRDAKGNTTHTISAETLTFNQQSNHVTARGNVVYKMQQADTEQDFKGEQISFNVEDYSGVFIEGMSSRERQIEDKPISFYFQGGSIYRIKRDIVNLERGIISSSRIEDPYYKISAGNLWILDLNEWALKNAVLYIGHIPVLYIPFFYRPGATFILHPSIGIKTEEGYYIQTTTYFLGRQPEDLAKQSSLSFMQAVEDDQQQYAQELRGFFLHSTRQEPSDSWVEKTDSYAKFQIDYYTRLGLLAAVNFDLNDVWLFDSIDLLTGFGFTNYIYPLEEYTNAFTIYTYDTEKEIYRETPQHAYILGNEIPFRFGFDLQLELTQENINISLSAPLYTDVLLHDQLRERNESFAWSKLLTGEGIQTEGEISDFTNPKFYQHTAYNFSYIEKLNFVDTFKFDKIDTRLNLSQGELEEDSGAINQIGFYYPQTFTPIDLEMNISGTLLKDGTRNKSGSSESDNENTMAPPTEVRPPWKDNEHEDEEEKKKTNDQYKIPSQSDSIAVVKKQIHPFFDHTLSYAVSPDFSYHTQYDTDSFETAQDVDFLPLYSYFFTDGTANIAYNADVFRNTLQIKQSTKFRGRYRDHFDEKEDYDIENLLEQDKTLSYFSIITISDLKHFFLNHLPKWTNSYAQYKIESELYRYSYDDENVLFESTYPEWNEESIRSHVAEVRLKYDSIIGTQEIYSSYKLPPLLQQLTGGIKTSFHSFSTSIEGKYSELEDESWEFGPLDVSTQMNFFNSSKIAQQFTFFQPGDESNTSISTADIRILPDALELYDQFEWDLDNERPERNISKAQLWWLSSTYEMRYTDDYLFSLSNGWEKTGEESFQPYQFSVQLDIPIEPEPFWKRRVDFETTISSALQMNMIRYTDSVLQFSWNTTLSIAEFLDLRLKVSSVNNTIYRYFPAFTDEIGVSTLDLFEDLYNSVSFSDESKRLSSKFNLQDISFSLIHYMHDWQLNMEYSGRPELNEENQYTWNSEFSIFVQWNPIPEIRKQIDYTDDTLQM